jgi:endonuclease/exonuclease/phosphatase family metal-dependent hydrolase
MRYILNVFLGALLLLSCGGKDKAEPPISTSKKLNTQTYNIHHGAPENSNAVNLSNIAAVIRKSGAELVALQEVDVNVARSGNVNQAQEIAKLLDMHFYFSKSINYSGGEYGVAILSKYPLTNTRNELLPMPTAGEQRSVAMATINLPGDVTVEFASTHLDLNIPNRTAQAERLNAISKSLNKPFFVGGDYNAIPTSSEMVKLKEEFNLSCVSSCPFSFPVRTPNKAIDFVAFNKSAASKFTLVAANAMIGEYASDHLPVVAVFNYK